MRNVEIYTAPELFIILEYVQHMSDKFGKVNRFIFGHALAKILQMFAVYKLPHHFKMKLP